MASKSFDDVFDVFYPNPFQKFVFKLNSFDAFRSQTQSIDIYVQEFLDTISTSELFGALSPSFAEEMLNYCPPDEQDEEERALLKILEEVGITRALQLQ